MAVMILCVIPFFPCGQTRWEDKNILYREAPQAKPKRTYKKRIKKVYFVLSILIISGIAFD